MKTNSAKAGNLTAKKYTDMTAVFVGVLITAFLFCFGAKGYETIDIVKRHCFYGICGGYCAIIIGLQIYDFVAHRTPVKSLKHRLADSYLTQLFAILYLLFSLIATIASPYRQFAWLGASRGEGFLTIAIYCLSFIFAAKYIKIQKWMLWLFGVSCFFFSLICVLQLESVNVFSLFPEGYSYWDGDVAYHGKYIGTIGNIDHVASFLSLAIPVLWCAVCRVRDKKRFLLLIPLLMLTLVLIRIRVAAGLLAVFAGAVCCFPVVLPAPRRLRVILAVLLIMLIVFGLVLVKIHDFDNQTIHEAHELLNGRGDASFGSGRIHIWTEVMKKTAGRFMLGYGPDTMIFAGVEPFRRYDDAQGKTIVGLIDAAHNEYLNVLFHQGVLALFAFLCIIAVSLTGWIKKAQDSIPAAICGCGVLCYSIQALFGISQPITSPFFWLLTAMLVKSCDIRMSSIVYSK